MIHLLHNTEVVLDRAVRVEALLHVDHLTLESSVEIGTKVYWTLFLGVERNKLFQGPVGSRFLPFPHGLSDGHILRKPWRFDKGTILRGVFTAAAGIQEPDSIISLTVDLLEKDEYTAISGVRRTK